MEKFVITGGKPLHGEVIISGAKNAAVGILPATILAADVCVIENLPDISDVAVSLKILSVLGAKVRMLNKNTYEIDTTHLTGTNVPDDLSRQMRASYYFLGALLSRFGKAQVAMPGGCNLGPRPIDQHLKVFSALGADDSVDYGMITVHAEELNGAKRFPGKHKEMLGIESLDKVIDIDQSPIGRTPRSNPATYTGVFNDIRELFAMTSDAKSRGYTASRFSFNVKGGRCETCQGDGIMKIEMHFLPDIFVPCEVCHGARYNRETLEVKYKGKNIYDVLEMTVEEAVNFFSAVPKIHKKLLTLFEVGLGYVKLGQSATTLSGGEAQRVKLATELAKPATGRTIYILDEPTTGLHTADVHRLIEVLQKLVDKGNTVLVIEHNLDIIKTADHVIDLGPDGGDKGGNIIAVGTPEEVAAVEGSYTGQYLKKVL